MPGFQHTTPADEEGTMSLPAEHEFGRQGSDMQAPPPRLRRAPLAALAVALVLTALVGISALLIGEFGETQGKLLGTAAAVLVYTLVSFPSFLHLDRRRHSAVALLALAATTATLALLLVLLWGPEGERGFQTLGSLAIAGFALNHVLLLLLQRNRTQAVQATLTATLVTIGVVSGMLIFAIWGEPEAGALLRVLGVFLILDVLGTILVPVLARIRPA